MNIRTNEDKIQSVDINYNAIHLVEDISEESGSVEEPVTLQEVKNYLRLEGWQADDDSPGDDFDFDDDLITSMITEGRLWVEKFTGIHCVSKTLQVVLSNGAGMLEIPGPVTGSISITDEDAGSIDDAEFIGTLFKKMITAYNFRLTLQYAAGYTRTTAPQWVKNAIKAYVAFAYQHRGDEELPGSPIRAAAICRPHRRIRVWA